MLVWHVLQRGILDAVGETNVRGVFQPREVERARDWIRARHVEPPPFSFEWICSILSLNPDTIRHFVRHNVPKKGNKLTVFAHRTEDVTGLFEAADTQVEIEVEELKVTIG